MQSEVETHMCFSNTNEDGTLQNPTITHEAETISKSWGKKSTRSITGTFWCDSEKIRNEEFERIKEIWPSSRYLLFGPIEWTEENKKPHLHFVICFNSNKMLKTILKSLPSKLYHLEIMRNFINAVEYCLKSNPNDKLEYGEPLKQGARTDLKKIYEETEYNANRIAKEYNEIYIRYRNGINATCEIINSEKNMLDWLGLEEDNGEYKIKEYKPPKVYWFYGPTQKGKTYEVKKIIRNKIINKEITKSQISRIDDFKGGFAVGDLNLNSKILIIDEFRGDKLKLGQLLQIIDGCNINIKGSKIYIHAEEIYITSCQHPKEAYHSVKSDKIEQLLRRITEIKNFGGDEFEEYDDL